jgi:hypothetical protein
MIHLFEKIQYGVSGVILLAVFLLYYFIGGMESRSKDLLSDLPTVATEHVRVDPEPAAGPTANAEGSPRQFAAVARSLQQQGVAATRTRSIERREFEVPEDVYEFVAKPRNWMPELNKAASRPIQGPDGRPTMLEVRGIEDGSLFEKFGVEDGDRLVLLDGAILEFDQSRTRELHMQARSMLEKLERGGTISFTILRGGKPVHLEFHR